MTLEIKMTHGAGNVNLKLFCKPGPDIHLSSNRVQIIGATTYGEPFYISVFKDKQTYKAIAHTNNKVKLYSLVRDIEIHAYSKGNIWKWEWCKNDV